MPVRDPEQALPVEEKPRRSVNARSRRDFLALGAGAAGLVAGWRWLLHRPEIGQMPSPFRRVLNFDGRLAQHLPGTQRMARTYAVADANPDFRINGDIGMTAELDLSQWRLQVLGLSHPERSPQYSVDAGAWGNGLVESTAAQDSDGLSYGSSNGTIPQSPGQANASAPQPGLLLTLDDLQKLPHHETVTEFKCIEGWSEIVHWGGVRMVDFLDAFGAPATKYMGLETPTGDFYAGEDMATMRHPQTLLAYELNGQPLSLEHGAPLRLATPLKYGYKQIKQISKIFFSDQRPRDYWEENGYDFYAGF